MRIAKAHRKDRSARPKAYGLKRLHEDGFPLSLRLLREIHEKLLASGRGSEKNPGEFRKSQNWIGGHGSTLTTAVFVPPAFEDMTDALDALERYFHEADEMPPLVKIALIHAQFETIHPFMDGNGRIGRLLITFYFYQQGILSRPLLYLSYYFKRNRTVYYEKLMGVRNEGESVAGGPVAAVLILLSHGAHASRRERALRPGRRPDRPDDQVGGPARPSRPPGPAVPRPPGRSAAAAPSRAVSGRSTYRGGTTRRGR